MEVSKGSKIILQTIRIYTQIKKVKLIKVTSLILMRKNLHLTKGMIMKRNGETKIKQSKILIQIMICCLESLKKMVINFFKA